jgi:hypothetical protein
MNILERHVMLFRAIKSLRAGAQFTLFEDETIAWDDKIQTQPSQQEIEDEVVRLIALDESLEYQRLRAKEYPTFADQFDLLYHGGYDAWKSSIDAVKSKYPKE